MNKLLIFYEFFINNKIISNFGIKIIYILFTIYSQKIYILLIY
jgi:hypothetical protein